MQSHVKSRFGFGALALTAVVGLGLAGAALWPVVADAKGGGGPLTHSFQNATPEQVLEWLKGQGIQVQFNKSDLPDRTLSFAFDGVQRDQVVLEFGRMIGFSTQKRGDVYSLMKGVGGDSTSEYLGSEGTDQDSGSLWGNVPFLGDQDKETELKKAREMQLQPGQNFVFGGFGQDPGSIVDEVMKALDEAGVFDGKKLSEDQRKALREKIMARIKEHEGQWKVAPNMPQNFQWKELPGGKGFALGNGDMKNFQFKEMPGGGKWYILDPEHAKELQNSDDYKKAMVEAQKAMEQALAQLKQSQAEGNGRDQALKAIQESMAALRKALEQLHGGTGLQFMDGEGLQKFGDMKFNFDSDAFKKAMEEMNKNMGENMKVLQIKMENLKKFIASLTPEQKKLSDKQGYLKPSDLTKEQRELLGIGDDGHVDMTFQMDDQKVRIKSDDKDVPKKGGNGGVITA